METAFSCAEDFAIIAGRSISIVTPSFNQAAFIERTLRSVLLQGYPKLEYIVIDGGSTDGSVDILRRYAHRLACFTSEKDTGQSNAVNKGFRRTTGDIIGWLNSDDELCAGALECISVFFSENPECDAVVGDLEVIDADDRLLDLKKAVPVDFRRNLYSGCAVPQPATFFTRRALELTGELDETLHYQMDYEFFLRMQARGVRFGLLKHPLARFRLHGDSKTVSNYDSKFWRDFGRVQDIYLRVPLRGRTREAYRQGMKWLLRLEMFLARLLQRGVFLPFRNTRARSRISR